jgi:hypothetical protein
MAEKQHSSSGKTPEAPEAAASPAFTSQGSGVQTTHRPPLFSKEKSRPDPPSDTAPTGTSVPRRQLLPLLTAKIVTRFWQKVDRGDPRKCWVWLGTKKKGRGAYGHFKILSYTTVTASRLAYAIAYGEEPGELMVLHNCDNPECCNPSHLYLGTGKDNSRDMLERGRASNGYRKGSSNGANKLTARDVYTVIRCIRRGQNNVQIGKRFGVNHGTISAIRLGKSWGHLVGRLLRGGA